MRNDAIEYMANALNLYGENNAAAAVDLFDEILHAEGLDVSGVMPTGLITKDEIERIARYQAGKIVEGDIEGFISQIEEATGFLTYQSANRAMMRQSGVISSGGRYRVTQGSGRNRYRYYGVNRSAGTYQVRYARIPQGAETCDWCLMLCSRGFVYMTAESAGAFDHWHRGCDCLVVAGVGHYEADGTDTKGRPTTSWEQDTMLEGYDLDDVQAVYDKWQELDDTSETLEADKLDVMELVLGRREW